MTLLSLFWRRDRRIQVNVIFLEHFHSLFMIEMLLYRFRSANLFTGSCRKWSIQSRGSSVRHWLGMDSRMSDNMIITFHCVRRFLTFSFIILLPDVRSPSNLKRHIRIEAVHHDVCRKQYEKITLNPVSIWYWRMDIEK